MATDAQSTEGKTLPESGHRRSRRGKRIPKNALRLIWNPKQSRFLKSLVAYLLLEGGVRAGKSFVLCFKVLYYCIKYPGIHCALTRWTQDGLDAQLRPVWRYICGLAGVSLKWHADEEYDELITRHHEAARQV